jgi:transposase InsO family protein
LTIRDITWDVMRVDHMVTIRTRINIHTIGIYMDQLTDEDRELLERLYKDPSLAINSVEKLYLKARSERLNEDGKIIKRDLVRAWYNKRAVNQRQKPVTHNSWVGNYPREEFKLDMAYMTFLKEEYREGYDFALICVDVFSKRVFVVPVGNLEAHASILDAMKICSKRMRSPSYVYSDEGPEFTNKAFKQLLADNGISQVFTVKLANFAERFVQTLKQYMMKKTEETGKTWKDLLDGHMHSHNTSEHSRTGMRPAQASKDENSASVRAHLMINASVSVSTLNSRKVMKWGGEAALRGG